MSFPLSFIFFHYGGIPRYLRASVESVRFFNPDARIILVCDSTPHFPVNWNLEIYSLEEFVSPELEAFRKAYVHVSVFPEKYERFVLERWFLFETLKTKLDLKSCVVLDSDMVVFSPIEHLFSQLPDKEVTMCGYSPHFTLIPKSVKGFLEHIMQRYTDPRYIEEARVKFAKARKEGGLKNLGEMEFVWEYMSAGTTGQPYERLFKEGYTDVNLHLPDGFKSFKMRRRSRKIVKWRYENSIYRPYLVTEATGEYVPAVTLHFQGGSKRLIRRFNRIGKASILPPDVRCAFLNLMFNHTLGA